MPPSDLLRLALVPLLLLAFAHARAQVPTSPPAPGASAPARAASAPARSASQPQPPAQRVEITGGRESDTEARRRSTASKIVIGREELDKFGDATVGEVLRRLPGVTTPGAPGRGGAPRMRGLGGGFTQLLIDGQRIPPGFSLESLTPEQIERIEILRAPTAETGARAIAGTINLITREGYKRRVNDLRLGLGVENGRVSPSLGWTRNDTLDDLTYNLSASLFRNARKSSNESHTTVSDVASGAPLEDRRGRSTALEQRTGVHLTTRLQWRLGEGGDMLLLAPMLVASEGHSDTRFALDQALRRPSTPAFYDTGRTEADSRFATLRLNGQWRQRLGGMRLELQGGGGASRSSSDSLRNEYGNASTLPIRVLEERALSKERSLNLTFKASGLAGGEADGKAGGEHSLVSGAEIEALNRDDTRSSLQNGVPLLTDFGDELQARSLRLAAYAQDEWPLTPHWGAHAGLRWEGITTQGDAGGGERPTNRSSVVTPLLHAVWKPDPKGRDQIRMSLTRSYRSPALASLIARPSISRDYPSEGANRETSPDNAGNPNLKPELARGIDIALERYLEGGGVLSANLFQRNITNLMRGVTALETVTWSPVPRWVRRTQNIGDAVTSGLELEAKFRLGQLIEGAPAVEMRSNLALYHSRVAAVPGPDNRLDQQAKGTANLGADYRLRGTPLTLGGNLNWVPGYTTRLEADQTSTVSTKLVWDAFALWAFSPDVGLRLLGNNLAPRAYTTTSVNDTLTPTGAERTTSVSRGPSYTNLQLRLELKL
ncbi:MAG: TonB-dependent receptor [Rubrivivax sp.]|nr:TonB-dependent receptor [Rubrivivax sp.]